MRYFFITYNIGGACIGNIILPQNVNPEHTQEHGMNFAACCSILASMYNGIPCVIISFHETTELRYLEWKKYMKGVAEKLGLAEEKKKFGVLEGGGEGNAEKLAKLQTVRETPPATEPPGA